MELGEKIRTARVERSMTLADLAAATNLTKGFLSQVEHGLSNPSLESLGRIASALGLSLSGLLANQDPTDARPTARDAAPRAFRNIELSARGVPVVPLVEGPAGAFAVVQLIGGASLETSTLDGQAFAQGFCYVLSGEALFEQNGVELTLSQGDALSWNAGSPYTMQNRQRAPLSLLLSIGAQGVLPTVREPAPAIADRSQYAPDPRFSEGGPMRLVAMRAHRRATRSG